jgi:hypothetical protein
MQTLFTLKEQGGVRLQKFLSFSPAAVCKYIMSASDPTLQGRTVDQVSILLLLEVYLKFFNSCHYIYLSISYAAASLHCAMRYCNTRCSALQTLGFTSHSVQEVFAV